MDPADTQQEAPTVQDVVTHQGILLGQHEQSIQALLASNQQLRQQVSALTQQISALLSLQSNTSAQPAPSASQSFPPAVQQMAQLRPPRESCITDPDPFSAAEVDWTDKALQAAFKRGLSEHLKDELMSRDGPADLDSLVSLANKIDNRLRARRKERSSSNRPVTRLSTPPPHVTMPPSAPGFDQSSTNAPEPMQLGRARLTPEERQRRRQAGECLYCGKTGHFLSSCPTRPKGGAHL
ncbi:hypothetical protein WMY93_009886 [Mugilogobius chulae]|uniref:CCHC-type domain-containing protein n=1 Tax=Mugilogobius chulae TaxID=88201 RepID=A0AAW0PEW5_9GOBI